MPPAASSLLHYDEVAPIDYDDGVDADCIEVVRGTPVYSEGRREQRRRPVRVVDSSGADPVPLVRSGTSTVTYAVRFHRDSPPAAQRLHDDIDRDERYRAPAPAGLDEIMDALLEGSCCELDAVYDDVYRRRSSLLDLEDRDDEGQEDTKPKSALRTSRRSRRSDPNKGYSKTIRFADVHISQFPMTLGHHPSSLSGPPVMLDWDSDQRVDTTMPLESYERTRPKRRTRRQLRLSLQQRHHILCKQQQFSFEQVKSAWQRALDVRKQRQETLERNPALLKWDEAWESVCRKTARMVGANA